MTIQSFIKKKKVASTHELLKVLPHRMAIAKHVELGDLVPLQNGLYASPSIDVFHASAIATSRYYPHAVISNLTALVIHKLSDEAITRIDIDIERHRSIRNALVSTHRVAKRFLTGITAMPFHGERIRIYDLERTLCDAYRLDPAGPIFFKALKRYVKHHTPDFAKIKHYDRVLKTKVLLHLAQELADA